ncbi:MAG: 2TM domain-containing protein [Burkholderiaceae bacterium]|nr:2TM domain-containing protein [Burkholderiaceae bacterium]MDO9090310.1 2TM domain-containing protein [Burkholderiaceae bacterium]MDP1968480.1 2TM domain-containing protein [Burkholderiaceae bacterium]
MNTIDMPASRSAEALERLAQRRMRRKMGWYVHALVYIAVNICLAALAATTGRNWAVFPALGWGLGLLIHAAVVFLAMPGGSLQAHLLERERETLRREGGGS